MGEMNVATGAVRTASRHGTRPVTGGGGAPARDVVPNFVGTPAKVRKSGMSFPQNLPERAWEEIGTNLRELVNSSAWWLADWLLFGEATYGWRRYKEAIERTGLDYQTLRNYAWVARRFEHHRRHDALSFAHHAEVTRLSPPEQDYWLRRAEQQKWSRNELRKAVRAALAAQNDTPPANGMSVNGSAAPGTSATGPAAPTAIATGTSATAMSADGASLTAPSTPATGTSPTGPAPTGTSPTAPAPTAPAPTGAPEPTAPDSTAPDSTAPGITVTAGGHAQGATLTLELSAGQFEYYSKAAAAHGLSVGKWVTQVLDTADRRSAQRASHIGVS